MFTSKTNSTVKLIVSSNCCIFFPANASEPARHVMNQLSKNLCTFRSDEPKGNTTVLVFLGPSFPFSAKLPAEHQLPTDMHVWAHENVSALRVSAVSLNMAWKRVADAPSKLQRC